METVKDFLIYNINPSSKVEPTSIQFKMQNCIISVGKSTCASTITLSAPSGKSYSVKNVTRNITSTNLLTPNNYISIAGASPVYTVTSSPLSDAANYARNGTNDLTVYE